MATDPTPCVETLSEERTTQAPPGSTDPAPVASAALATASPAEPAMASSAATLVTPRARLRRLYTEAGKDPLHSVRWTRRDSRILNPDGSAVFEMSEVEVPEDWSQLATDIMASKYFRKAGVPETGSERSAREVIQRVAQTLRKAGEEQGGIFADDEDARTFEDELTYMLAHQIGAFNSPVWFNCGLSQHHGITGRPVGNWRFDPEQSSIELCADAYTHPQLSACFIQSIDDDLLDIAEAVKREMQLFKFGSGTGTNFSALRAEGERLSGGGTSSGLMSFLEILDRAAGATKSGGTTRRAAKMVILDMDHPDIEAFITWKAREEDKALALVRAGYDPDFNGEAYRTVSGQNSNNSVRIPDGFMDAVVEDREWATTWRTNGEVAKVYRARDLLESIAGAAWRCADPGVQFDSTINRWHTCKHSGRINASNPCSEYMFLDDSACNLASLNLLRFVDDEGTFDLEAFEHAIEIFITATEIIVDFASYPTREIAQNSHDFRPLGLGFANLGTLLMVQGRPYDSDGGRNMAAALTSLMTGRAYATSAAIAARRGPFNGYWKNRESMLEVMAMHRTANSAIDGDGIPADLLAAARGSWDEALHLGAVHGFRNAQVSVIAPTGTIGLLMDCDTTGIEPEFALVKFKKLAGGGYFKIINQSVPRALAALGYDPQQIDDIRRHVLGTQTLDGARHLDPDKLQDRGLSAEAIERIEAALPTVFDLRQAFSAQVIGQRDLERLELDAQAGGDAVLAALGYTRREIDQEELAICGHMTIEGAPHLRDEHLAIFDCATRCGRQGQRCIHHMGHIRMMAAVQPFISGAISKTINMPNETTVDEIREAYFDAWRLGLKAVALYRDGCKQSQPLQSSGKRTEAVTGDSEPGGQRAGNGAGAATTAVAEPEVTGCSNGRPHGEAAAAGGQGTAAERTAAAQEARLIRQRLPKKRRGFTQEARVGGNKVYVRTGEYPDGRLGEIFVDMHKEGAAFRSLMNCLAIAVSLGLQHGVPLEEYVDAFVFTRFDPQGPVDHPNIKFATSVIDYIFRVLGMEYLGRRDFVHIEPADQDDEEERAVERSAHSRAGASGVEPTGDAARGDTRLAAAGAAETAVAVDEETATRGGDSAMPESPLSQQARLHMADAPFCDTCGHLAVRNGSCYKCLNCGNSMGCS